MWFSEYLFLERSWAKDESTLKKGLRRLKDFPQPFWLALFVEGTRFTRAKLLAAQEYATSTGLPVPRNVLIPRTKGFVTAVSQMRSFVPAIYDVTLAIPKNSPAPTMLRLVKGEPSVLHVHLKRHSMKNLPESDEEVSQWCKDIFVAKDSLLDKHIADNTFGDQEHDLGRPIKSLVVVILWSCLLILGSLNLIQWSSLLSSWKGITFSAVAVGVVTVLMQILIKFSQAERSAPAKVTPAKPKNVQIEHAGIDEPAGLDVIVDGTVLIGSGLSSSATFVCSSTISIMAAYMLASQRSQESTCFQGHCFIKVKVWSLIEDIKDARFHKIGTGLEIISERTYAMRINRNKREGTYIAKG